MTEEEIQERMKQIREVIAEANRRLTIEEIKWTQQEAARLYQNAQRTPSQIRLAVDYRIYEGLKKLEDKLKQSPLLAKDESGEYKHPKEAQEILDSFNGIKRVPGFEKYEQVPPLMQAIKEGNISPEDADIYVQKRSEAFLKRNKELIDLKKENEELTDENKVLHDENEELRTHTTEQGSEQAVESQKISVVRHRYGKENSDHKKAIDHATKRNNGRLKTKEKEIAIQNLQRMEELGLIAKGPEGTSNAEVYLYRLHQSKLYYDLTEKVQMSDGTYQPVSKALASESGKTHRNVYKDITTKALDDETLKDYARTINITEGCISNKGVARTTHKIPVRNNRSFKAGSSNNIEVVKEEIEVKSSSAEQEQSTDEPNVSKTLKSSSTEYDTGKQESVNKNAVALKKPTGKAFC